MNQTNWLPGIIVLMGGLISGVVFVLLSRREPAPGGPAEDPVLADLEQRYRMLINQLKELIADKHQLPQAQFDQQRLDLELAAADALKARAAHLGRRQRLDKASQHEALKSEKRAKLLHAAEAARAQTFFGRRPVLKGLLWATCLVAFFAGMGLLLSQESKVRDESMEMTGGGAPGTQPADLGQGAPPGERAEDARFRAAMERMQRDPEDLDALSEVAHELILFQNFEQAKTVIDRAIGLDPFHAETRIHRAVLRGVNGQLAEARAELEHLANTYPGAHEALLYAGGLALQASDKKAALAHFERYLVEAPPAEQPPRLREGIRQLRSELGM